MTAKNLSLLTLLLGVALATCVERRAPARPAAPDSGLPAPPAAPDHSALF